MLNKSAGIILCFVLLVQNVSQAQKMERKRVDSAYTIPETFWAPNLVGMGTVENIGRRSLNLTIMHNFGLLTDRTLQNFFGFDVPPNVRLGLDYGITSGWSVGIGRSTFEKVVDLRTKLTLIRQGPDGSVPVSISIKADVGLETVENNRPVKDDLNYLLALPVARRLNEAFSLQLSPMYAHFNSVNEAAGEQKNLLALGMGGAWHLSRRYAVIAEYYPVLGKHNPGTKNAVAIGINIETGGHVFQLYFASSSWHNEQYIMARNEEDFRAGDFRFGFNVNRLFSL